MTNASTTKPQELSSSNWERLLELVKILQKVLIWWRNSLKTQDSKFGVVLTWFSSLMH